jgi:hypothetical protein
MHLLQAVSVNPQVSLWTVILALLGSGILSTLITTRANRNLKDTDFTYDFRKYILEKRKIAYDEVEKLLALYLSQGDVVRFLATPTNVNWRPLETLSDKAGEISNNNIWLSNEIAERLSQFSFFLFRLRDRIDDDKYSKSHDLAVDPVVMEKYLGFEVSLLKVLFEDIASLDNIQVFQTKKINELRSYQSRYN